MEKTRINLDVILPEIPDERDACVDRIIKTLQQERGIDKVHLVPQDGQTHARLCFHYDPESIAVNQVEQLAIRAGAAMTEQYGHLLVTVQGIRQPRHARIIEAGLKEVAGVLNAAVSGTGFIQLEYDKQQTTEPAVLQAIKDKQLSIQKVENFHHHPHHHKQPKAPHDHPAEACKEHGHGHGHSHSHGGIFGEKTELICSLICGALLGIGFGLSWIELVPAWVSLVLYIGAYIFGGFYTAKEAIEGIASGSFEIDFLMLVAAVGAAFLGQWAEGALLLFLFSLGHSLEHSAMEKARKSIAALTDLAPKTALLKKEGGLQEVKIDSLQPGDIILVKPNTKIAADGIVVHGNSSVNQAPVTGESMPVEKMPVDDPAIPPDQFERLDGGFKVFAGTVNGAEVLEIKVSKVAADSTIARLVQLVNEAQTQKSATQRFTDQLEKYYVPSVLILVVLLLFAFLVVDESFGDSFYRAMAVLVAASPCALAISVPSAVLSGVARAARGGVLIKGGRPLEDLGGLRAIAFDKTGTLTQGKPVLTGVYPYGDKTEEELLILAMAVEQLSDHPLAAAVVKGAQEKLGRMVPAATNLEAVTGRGVRADLEGKKIAIGNKELFTKSDAHGTPPPEDMVQQLASLESQGHTAMVVKEQGQYVGIITLMDTARTDARATLMALQKMGIRKMVMLTGDNQRVAEAIAAETGITEARGSLLPQEKVEAVRQLKAAEGQVAMVGDGVNDAPAMAQSTVGIAMGAAGSDVALETADIALMADKLGNLPFAIGLSKKAHTIIRQNLVISLGMVALLVPLTLLGIAEIGPAVIGHEGSTLLVVLNALRLLGYHKEKVRA